MFVALLRLDLRIPGCGSLKEKRHVVKTLTSAVRNAFGVSVAETGSHDLWQRTGVGDDAGDRGDDRMGLRV